MTSQQIILTREELQMLTGLKRSSSMKSWLEHRGWLFEPPNKSSDFPKVARQYFDYRMSGTPLPGQRRSGPNLDFFKRT